MKLVPLALALTLLAGPMLHAEDAAATKIVPDISQALAGFNGKVVELRLKSGDKIGGTVVGVGVSSVQLSQLTGAEFFEAVVGLDSISAVVVRSKSQ